MDRSAGNRSGQRISVCGKGGSGKSTIVALLANELARKGHRLIVLDSDESNACLHWMLGFDEPPHPLLELVGGKKNVQRQMRQTYSDGEQSQMSVLAQPQFAVRDLPPEYVAKKDGKALIAVGKIHQALEGCACPMGVLSREFLKKLQLADGEVLLVDMEAGIEHFGRGVETSIDAVVVVVEPSLESVTLAEKIKQLASEAGARFAGAILNKVSSPEVKDTLTGKLQDAGVSVLGEVGYHEELFSASLAGEPIPPVGDQTRDIVADLLHLEPAAR